MKAQQIELDMATNNFDPSLSKYKPQKYESISVSQLFDQFVEYKRHTISIGGLNKYSRFHVDEVHPDCSSIAVGTRHCRVPTSVVYLTNLKSAVSRITKTRF